MGRLIKAHQPCEDCGSSDGLTYYDDGTHCFVCNSSHPLKEYLTSDTKYGNLSIEGRDTGSTLGTYTLGNNLSNNNNKDNIYTKVLSSTIGIEIYNNNKDYRVDYRKIKAITLGKYKVGIKDNKIYYPYAEGKGFKVRTLDTKGFFTEGSMKDGGLFGKEAFPKSSNKIITITEGENDAMAVYQMNGGYPAVSVKSASSARRDSNLHRP